MTWLWYSIDLQALRPWHTLDQPVRYQRACPWLPALVAKVLHLDIAPSNILMSPEGRCLLVDFHLAQMNVYDADDEGSGRIGFKSISRLRRGKATLSGETHHRCWACRKNDGPGADRLPPLH